MVIDALEDKVRHTYAPCVYTRQHQLYLDISCHVTIVLHQCFLSLGYLCSGGVDAFLGSVYDVLVRLFSYPVRARCGMYGFLLVI